MIKSVLAAVLLCLAPLAAHAAAPQPAKPVALSDYSGRWYEIARMPNRLQRGCVSGTVDYAIRDNRLHAVQRCITNENRRARTFRSSGRILDPGVNAKARLTFSGFWSQDYWVIDHSHDWALIGDPSGKYLWVMSRAPRLSAPAAAQAIGRVRALGYDASKLEFTAAPG